ncbi:hypothetical protein ACNRBH_17860 [Ralstonia pseudosolanacearum]|uniref:hypothetical protein n=1 Tax=Ralstonia pseudosolanacearum TaxID=1310165 RepID=UPI003AB06950
MRSLFYAGALHQGIIRGGSFNLRTKRDFSQLLAQSRVARRLGVHKFSQGSGEEALKGRGLVHDPVRAIALLTALWGDWSAVEKAIQDDRLLRLEGIPPREDPPSLSAQQHRQWGLQRRECRLPMLRAEYKRLRASDLSLTRAQILLDLPYDRFLLRAEDMDAVDEELFGKLEELDNSLARHVFDRADTLRRLRHPSRITTELLLEGHPLGQLRRSKHQKLHRTTAALRAKKESSRRFWERMRSDLGGDAPLNKLEERDNENL